MQLVGVCEFDDVKSASAGWASICGNKAVRISNRGQLQSDVLWITNILWHDYKNLNLIKLKNIFDDQFFRNSYTFYCRENGLIDDPTKKVEFFSEIFSRLSEYCENKLKINIADCTYRIPILLRDLLLDSKYRKQAQGPNSLEIMTAIKQSTQEIQKMTGSSPQGSTTHNFIFPRGAYTRWLFSQTYPNGENWIKLSEKKYTATFGHDYNTEIKGTKAVINMLLELGKKSAVFFKTTILTQDTDFVNYQCFGAGANYQRKWSTLPEILHLSRFSKIKIEGGFACDQSPLSLKIPLNCDESEFSLSRSIFLDCLWVGVASPFNVEPKIYSPVAAYMRAFDRIACAKAAERFYKDGSIIIGSFGTGRVTAYLRQSDISLANEISLKSGLIPPLKNLITCE